MCKLMEDITTGERVAVKLMERGPKVPHSARRHKDFVSRLLRVSLTYVRFGLAARDETAT